MQTEGASGRFKGVFHCVKTTVVQEGFRGLYKGESRLFVAHMARSGGLRDSPWERPCLGDGLVVVCMCVCVCVYVCVCVCVCVCMCVHA
jgi:hypothetical protein